MVPEGTRAPAGMTVLEKMVRQARALRIHQCLLRVPRIRRNRGDHPIWALSPPEKIDKNGMAGGKRNRLAVPFSAFRL